MPKPKREKSTATIDRHVGARIRERRVMLGLTPQQLAELIGVTYQQAHKYERGINRGSAGGVFRRPRRPPPPRRPLFPRARAGAPPAGATPARPEAPRGPAPSPHT